MTATSRNRGFSIVEIMIALVISMVLMAGVIQIYLGSKQSYRLNQNVARMQENSRFAMGILTKEIRMAGFMPCPRMTDVAVTLDPTSSAFSLSSFGSSAIIGYEGGASTFPSEFPATGTSPGDRVANSDGFMLMRGGDSTYSVQSHVPTSAQFKVVDATGLNDGDILLVCDSENTAVFQTSNTVVGSGTVVHNAGGAGISPGNCTKGLGYPVVCTANGTSYTYGTDAQIVKFQSSIYYLGVSQSGDSNALYRRSLGNTGGAISLGAAVELIDGIESMQVQYGEDTDSDNEAERYVSADQVGTWNDVVSTRVGLLTHTPEQINTEDDTRDYYVAGTTIDDTVHGNDKRMRFVYTSTVKIRNRGIME